MEDKLKSAVGKNKFCNDIVFLPKPVLGEVSGIILMKMPLFLPQISIICPEKCPKFYFGHFLKIWGKIWGKYLMRKTIEIIIGVEGGINIGKLLLYYVSSFLIVVPITHDVSTLPCVANITPQMNSLGNVILDGQANASNMMCVSKARLGDLVCTLPASDMRLIDEAIAKTVGLMEYYADLTKKLNDKLSYIDRIKGERNKAQDELTKVRNELGLAGDEPLLDCILEMKKRLDNQQ